MPGASPLPYGTDQLIDATMARALHADTCRDHALVAWVVLWDLPAYPERFAAQLVTSGAVSGQRQRMGMPTRCDSPTGTTSGPG